VDDDLINRKMLALAVEKEGHQVTTAENGRQALALLRAGGDCPFDVILLDILMPEMDGYQVLEQVKGDEDLHHIPVIMISAVEEMDSVVRCIEMGATDYLPKPVNPALLRARLNASLVEKRLRDLELQYLEHVDHVVQAAQAVEAARFDPGSLEGVAARPGALGQLARVFQRMAREVHLREQRLQQQLQQLHLDIEEMRRAFVEPISAYVPMDRRQALFKGESLPPRTEGAALFADISGFTPLTAALAQELGRERGAEELTRLLDRVYGALIAEVHHYRGSVIGFSGDAITCWLDGDDGLQATACGLAMQAAMAPFASVQTPTGTSCSLGIKVAVVAGPVRRFLVGDPQIQNIEVIAGRMVDRLGLAEALAGRGEVVVQAEIVQQAGDRAQVAEWRTTGDGSQRFAVVSGLDAQVPPQPWPELPPHSLPDEVCRPWLPPAVYKRMRSGTKEFLAELRPTVALFLRFEGPDYDGDEDAGSKLDAYVRWTQAVVHQHEGSLLQVTLGDKGSYLYAAFGAPVAHSDDAARAVAAALVLQSPPPELQFIGGPGIGLAQGPMRTGAYGGPAQRTYGILGEKTNLAARLMLAAGGGILCDEAVYQEARTRVAFERLPPITVKGTEAPVAVYRPTGARGLGSAPGEAIQAFLDRLSPPEQLTLKVASIFDRPFEPDILGDIFPYDADKPHLERHLQTLSGLGLLVRDEAEGTYAFQRAAVRQMAYDSMLFAQRRHLHRLAAEAYERPVAGDTDWTPPGSAADYYAGLAHHWRRAEEPGKASEYLEKAGQAAARAGAYEQAERYLQESLALDAGSAVLSGEFYARDPADYEAARRYALERLERELPPELTYHNLYHTVEDVLPAVQRLAALSGIPAEEARLLEIAAVYHDTGFTVQRLEHERLGAEIAGQVLPGFGFSPTQVAAIQGMIMATQLPQSPRTRLEEILCDADLDVLGREDYGERNKALRAEMATSGLVLSDEDWCRSQLELLEKHRYFTAAARKLRAEGKQKNIEAVKERLARLTG
jgi:CheY-like chemotaxis protein/predicted metal-dependent HD superfamily phosphohydrolase